MTEAATAIGQLAGWGIVLLLASFLAGYIAGKRFGLARGMAAGKALAPLELRLRALDEGRCPICGANAADNRADDINDNHIEVDNI